MNKKLFINFLASSLIYFCMLTANASPPVEIVNWYKGQYPNSPISGICEIIRRDVDHRRENLLVVSKNGWSISESEAAWNECRNQAFGAIATSPVVQAKRSIEAETKRCEPHRQRANRNWNALAISLGRKAEADELYAKCEEALQPQLEAKRKALAEHEAELAQKASDEKAKIDAMNASIEFPNLPLSYFNPDQRRAYIAAMNGVSVEGVVARSEFVQAAKELGHNTFKSTWKIKVNAPRQLYSHGHRLGCHQTIAGKEKSIQIHSVAMVSGDSFKGPLNAGSNEIDVDVVLRDDEKFPVRHLIESARCVIRSNLQHSSWN